MTLTEKCPACGAPVEVSDVEGSTFRCGFCSTELQMRDINGELFLTVAGKPSPQSEVLSEKAQEVLAEEEAQAREESDFANLFGDMESGGTARSEAAREPERDIYVASFQGESMPEPPGVGDEGQVATGWATSAASMADANDWVPENRDTSTVTPPVTIPETPPYQAGREGVPAGTRSNTGRWIAIGLAVFVVVCIMCACLVYAVFAITGSNIGNF